MTSNIFENELHAFDVKMGSKNQNILLLLDHSPAHLLIMKFQNIKLAFYPANYTSELSFWTLGSFIPSN
jgi:hypothetical protein